MVRETMPISLSLSLSGGREGERESDLLWETDLCDDGDWEILWSSICKMEKAGENPGKAGSEQYIIHIQNTCKLTVYVIDKAPNQQ